ncbi:hypothetical protein FH869_03915 [Providencia rettgeri]|uniref:Uncharacterized protein n=1 Tax=Providencia rettgeri TaxID=587 RepID=A0A264VQL2_PRORE|nr:hypothetical protein CHI95_15170 [Providencia rettgeri]PYZ60149.1 hypothetical protein DNK63_13970 [Providencia rettgeri]QIF65267.1 hypothetical protein FVA72_06900 [Providencia sp. 1709051003]THB19681.1 hypothetical protein E6R27_21185 [Providencia sp. MGF014]TNV04054.1 hypothetical protein FH869_03915 [Providencia rettgeri]
MKINQENQFIDFRLITQSGKNHAFIPLCQQPQMPHLAAFFIETNLANNEDRCFRMAHDCRGC